MFLVLFTIVHLSLLVNFQYYTLLSLIIKKINFEISNTVVENIRMHGTIESRDAH